LAGKVKSSTIIDWIASESRVRNDSLLEGDGLKFFLFIKLIGWQIVL
jgi:hypothetical protein